MKLIEDWMKGPILVCIVAGAIYGIGINPLIGVLVGLGSFGIVLVIWVLRRERPQTKTIQNL